MCGEKLQSPLKRNTGAGSPSPTPSVEQAEIVQVEIVASRHRASAIDRAFACSALASDQWRLECPTPDLANSPRNRLGLFLQNFDRPKLRYNLFRLFSSPSPS